MKNRRALFVIVLFSLPATGLSNPVMFNGGVIDPRATVTRIDSAKLTFYWYDDMTFPTPGWGTHTPYDTFIFGSVPAAPETIVLHGMVQGFEVHTSFTHYQPDTWYPIGRGVVTSYVEFGGYPGVEESRSLAQRSMRLTVSPSVVTVQMTVRLQPASEGRPIVEIHDAIGNVVRSLDCTAGTDGVATATWNRKDDRGRLVPEGVYFCRYAASDIIAVRKVLVAH